MRFYRTYNARKPNYRRVYKYIRLWERVTEVFPHISYFGDDDAPIVQWCPISNKTGSLEFDEGTMSWYLPGISLAFWQKVMAEYKGRRFKVEYQQVAAEEVLVCHLPCGLYEFKKFIRPIRARAFKENGSEW